MYKKLPSGIVYIDKLRLVEHISSSNSTIHQAMTKLNNTSELFQIIVDTPGFINREATALELDDPFL